MHVVNDGRSVERTRSAAASKSATSNQQDAVPERLVGIGQRAVMILDVDPVELQQDLAVADDLLVLVAAVAALGVQHALVEALDAGTSRTTTIGCGQTPGGTRPV